MRLLVGALLLVTAAVNVGAQRPASASICDYYAMSKFGSNTTESQLLLMQHIVALAFGGRGSLSDAPETSTGILNPGVFNNAPVNLRSWFDGSKATTNLNNQPVGINWLDAGAEEPLHAFLNKSTTSVQIANTTNEFRLFTDFFTAFGFIFGCTGVRSFPKVPGASTGPINLAYAHKYMKLNSTHLGHFINQLTDAAKYYGFSTTDADTLETFMNARYNVRCAPAVNGQLYSLCQAEECPLAAPSPDCGPYANLGPTVNQTGSTGGAGPSSTSSAGPGPTSAAPSTAPAASEPVLSAGAIAGVAIGGAAVLLAAVGMVLWYRKRRHPQIVAVPMAGGMGGPGSPAYQSYTPSANPHHSVSTSYQPNRSHMSHMSQAPSEAGTYGPFVPKPEDQLAAGMYQHTPQSPPLVPQREVAEMDGQPASTGYWDQHQSIQTATTQEYPPSQPSATLPREEYNGSTMGPTSPYHPTSPAQAGDRRDHGPGGSVWQ